MRTAQRQVEAVAQARQHVQLRAGDAPHQVVSALAHHPDQEQQGVLCPVADGNGPPEEFAGQLDVHELPRRRDGGGVAGQHQLIGVGGQLPGVFHGKEGLFHR